MSLANIHNHYESLVMDEISRHEKEHKLKTPSDMLEDIACVALNRVPARYVKHSVDLIFYLTAEERQKMHEQVTQAVKEAYEVVLKE